MGWKRAAKRSINFQLFHINGHEADRVFGRGLPHKINNFDETWVENAKAKNINQLQVLSYNPHVLADTTTHENGMMPPPAGDGVGPKN